ncbi:hypothetical protein VOLCADRAFT_119942 [Volvox carteri f. nagariensis]|uniref:TRAF-type domain-containing protein n=1 Tax=Volvox carteri f. nagariensis TaxID=3068 RepID=D8UIA2_VOLCA|nr:uncharacterized protein VOLCADRAFT_119942 [Volvox carteri f. nagariensis]EFJ40553.1 hypothetical protein VOLCADRAFT_119942 [Volvox carteri f. nagariensis]|eukprot:XP_002958403.1 hypothetical protein VOLCADRAFT_119942 [Volvox carteri f. nagariensis]
MAALKDHPVIKKVQEELVCPICLETAQLPVNFTCFRGCGGKFSNNSTCLRSVLCLHCANDALHLGRPPPSRFPDSGGFAHCLICRETRVDARMLTPDNAYLVNHNVAAIMDALGLGAVCRRCDEDHESQSALHQHYVRRCPAAVVKCRFRSCAHWHTRSAAPEHEATCPVGRSPCGQCGVWVDRTDLLRHMVTTCRLRIVNCMLCKHSALLPDMLEHLRLHKRQLQGQARARAAAAAAAAAANNTASMAAAAAVGSVVPAAGEPKPTEVPTGGAGVHVAAAAAVGMAAAAAAVVPEQLGRLQSSGVVRPSTRTVYSADGRLPQQQQQQLQHQATALTQLQQQQLQQQQVQQQAQQLLEMLRRQQQQLLLRLQTQTQTQGHAPGFGTTTTAAAAAATTTATRAPPPISTAISAAHTQPDRAPVGPLSQQLTNQPLNNQLQPQNQQSRGSICLPGDLAAARLASLSLAGLGRPYADGGSAGAIAAAGGGGGGGGSGALSSAHSSAALTTLRLPLPIPFPQPPAAVVSAASERLPPPVPPPPAAAAAGAGVAQRDVGWQSDSGTAQQMRISMAIASEGAGVNAGTDGIRSGSRSARGGDGGGSNGGGGTLLEVPSARAAAAAATFEAALRRTSSLVAFGQRRLEQLLADMGGEIGGDGRGGSSRADIVHRRGAFWPAELDDTAGGGGGGAGYMYDRRRGGDAAPVEQGAAGCSSEAADEAARLVRTAAAIVRASAAASERRSQRQMALTAGGVAAGGGGPAATSTTSFSVSNSSLPIPSHTPPPPPPRAAAAARLVFDVLERLVRASSTSRECGAARVSASGIQ